MWRLMTYLCSVCLLLLAIPTEAITLQAGATYSSQTVSVSEAPDALPTAALYVNNTLDATPVTVSLKPGSTRSYYCTVTLPGGLSTGDRVEIRVDATVSATALEPGWLTLGIVETPVSVAVTTLESRHTTSDAALASAVTTINDNTNVRQLETLGEIASGNGGNNIQNILSAVSQVDLVVDALPTEAQITAAASGGPINQEPVAPRNIVTLSSRADGIYTANSKWRLRAGETRIVAIDAMRLLGGSKRLHGMGAPASSDTNVVNADATEYTDYGVDRSLAKVKLTVPDGVTSGATATVTVELQPSAGEVIEAEVEVEVR